MNMGADDYLTKPFTHSEVITTIRSRLDKYAHDQAVLENRLNQLIARQSQTADTHLLTSRIVAMFAHDFRSPLTLILMAADILKASGREFAPERRQQHYQRIYGSVHLLLQMLEDLLMLVEMEGGYLHFTPQSMGLGEFIGELVADYRLIDQEDHQFVYMDALTAVAPVVEADPKLIRQIITNLLSNASKYSDIDSTITLTLRPDSPTDPQNILIEIQDQGFGIPAESLPHLFEPFHRAENVRKLKGTGLGLSTVHTCVQQHHGHVTVESVLGVGSTFTVSIPLVQMGIF
jgi:two-component system, sensor histidine kinase and response regulator